MTYPGLDARNFNPLPPHGGRQHCAVLDCRFVAFQSTPSAWRETPFARGHADISLYFNPLPPHGGRRIIPLDRLEQRKISIHSLRMEGDLFFACGNGDFMDFNPLPPHGGRRHHADNPEKAQYSFQSTPSAWRETSYRWRNVSAVSHFNPLPPHGGRLTMSDKSLSDYIISIHSLRMEGDPFRKTTLQASSNFNPLPPHGGRQ